MRVSIACQTQCWMLAAVTSFTLHSLLHELVTLSPPPPPPFYSWGSNLKDVMWPAQIRTMIESQACQTSELTSFLHHGVFSEMGWVNTDPVMEELSTGHWNATHTEAAQRGHVHMQCCLQELFGSKLSCLYRARKKWGDSNYILWVMFILFFPRMIFLVILLKRGHLR